MCWSLHSCSCSNVIISWIAPVLSAVIVQVSWSSGKVACEQTQLISHFCNRCWPGVKFSISLSRVSHWSNNFLLVWSCSGPHASHMVWGAPHSLGITHMAIALCLPYTSHRSGFGSLFLSFSLCAITCGEAYLYLESAQESCRLFKALNGCWIPLAVRNCFGPYRYSFGWQKPVGPSSALASSLGLWRLPVLSSEWKY